MNRTCDFCQNPHHAKGMCRTHYMNHWRFGDPLYERPTKRCDVPGCDRPFAASGYCKFHGQRARRYGDPLREPRKPPPIINNRGYRMLHMPEHPNAYRTGRVLEHTVVMSETLGRRIAKGESIHHKNGNRLDNRPENLELWSSRHPPGQRVSDLLTYAREIIALYGSEDPDK